MISAGDFRNGVTIELEGNIFQIIEFQHVKPGKGAAFVRTKLKNIKSGGVVEKTFRPTEKCPQARIDRKDMQYLYSDGDLFYFMDVESYDQIALAQDAIGDALTFVKDEDGVYTYNPEGDVTEVVTKEDGTVVVRGLDVGTYAFKEVTAPEGYSINETPAEAELTVDDEAVAIFSDDTSMADTRLNALPSTGGIGTTMFTIGGCAIMVAAAYMYLASARKEEQ